jgi:AcrR family transcriptional regulator
MAAKAEDRRIQRTRGALREALIELILEQGYETITVQAIIDRANVGRSTFYAHYLDKELLPRDTLTELRAMLSRQQQAALEQRGGLGAGRFAFSLGMFAHAESHVLLYRAVVGKQSGVIVQREIQRIIADLVRAELRGMSPQGGKLAIPREVLVEYVVSAFMGLLIWWLEAGLPCPAPELDSMFQRLTMSGISTVLETAGDTP